jgi:hypothetical protein
MPDENLGPPVAWQIRDIPQLIRDMITEQARIEGVKVPELLTRLVLQARDASWSLKSSNTFANPSDRLDRERLRAAVAMVSDLGQAGVVQKRVATAANRLVMHELQAIEGPRPSAKRGAGPALPPPDDELATAVTGFLAHHGEESLAPGRRI